MTRKEAIEIAWNKISKYVKENYNEIFEKDLEFEWKHDVYGWCKFGVTSDGVAYIVSGSHGTSSLNDYYYHPSKQGWEPGRISLTEKVINNWPLIKNMLIARAEKEKNLYNFTV